MAKQTMANFKQETHDRLQKLEHGLYTLMQVIRKHEEDIQVTNKALMVFKETVESDPQFADMVKRMEEQNK
jgi:hypothetical protein